MISVVMPVYNSEKYLAEAIQSILNQTHKNFELICINDGSTDKSQEIIEYFSSRDARIVVINQPNKGVVSSLNLAISLAKYDYIARMDADGFAPIFPDICYHLTHYKPAAADIPVASDNPAHYADAIRYNAR
ncbi:glycosyltransferase family 2 protein, partial [Escherichia coli]|nr:glycosyltransferase family 2 protein [Escherichia coli]